MKEIKLSRIKSKKYKDVVALVDDSDYEHLNQWNWSINRKGSTLYAETRGMVKRKLISMHRFIMGVSDSNVLVDHIDGNGLNNCRSNLRTCTKAQNGMNRPSVKNKSSQYKGVWWHKWANKWAVEIRVNNKKKYIGLFANEVEAAKAYDNAARENHGEFANINFK